MFCLMVDGRFYSMCLTDLFISCCFHLFQMREKEVGGIIFIIECLTVCTHPHAETYELDVIHEIDFILFALTGAVAILLLLAVALFCAYELCAVYVTAGSTASERYSPSGFFFGVSAIALAINMLFICRMVFNGKACYLLTLLLVFPFC